MELLQEEYEQVLFYGTHLPHLIYHLFVKFLAVRFLYRQRLQDLADSLQQMQSMQMEAPPPAPPPHHVQRMHSPIYQRRPGSSQHSSAASSHLAEEEEEERVMVQEEIIMRHEEPPPRMMPALMPQWVTFWKYNWALGISLISKTAFFGFSFSDLQDLRRISWLPRSSQLGGIIYLRMQVPCLMF